MPRPIAVAITGGIGAGKSEALYAFQRAGAATVSSDEIVHHLLRTDADVRKAIVAELGEGVLAADGSIDRARVADVVFVKRVAPIRLAGMAIVAMSLPLWLLPLDLPAWGVMAALFTAMLFTPLVNGPVIGVITARTPPELRPKMMTALISVSALSAPLGFIVAGQLLESWGALNVFAAVAVGMTSTALVFAAIALRHRDEPVPESPAVAA